MLLIMWCLALMNNLLKRGGHQRADSLKIFLSSLINFYFWEDFLLPRQTLTSLLYELRFQFSKEWIKSPKGVETST